MNLSATEGISKQNFCAGAHRAVLCAIVFYVVTLLIYMMRGWYLLGIPPINPERPPFSDTYAQLVTADACLIGAGKWYAGVCFIPSMDVLPRSQTYEPWLTFSRLGLTHEHYIFVAWTIIAMFYVAISLLFHPKTLGQAALLGTLVFSPSVQLAIERGNFDILISTLIIVSGFLLARRSTVATVTGSLLLGASVTLKLYTGLSSALGWLVTGGRRKIIAWISIGSTILAVAILKPENIAILGRGAPEGATRFSTGAHLTFQTYEPTTAFAIVFASLVVGGSLIARAVATHARMPVVRPHGTRAVVFVIAYLTTVPLFFLKDSYDYRLILWLPMIALTTSLDAKSPLAALGRAATLMFLYTVFVELFCNVAKEAVGPRAFQLLEGTLVALKHVSMWSMAWIFSFLTICVIHTRYINERLE